MKEKIICCLKILSGVSLLCYTGIVAYDWGYMQSAIDNRAATFSAPAYVAVFSGIPFLIATIMFVGQIIP